MKTEDELYSLFSEGSVISFVPKPELTVGTGALMPGVGGKKGTMVTFTPIGQTVLPDKEFGHKLRKNVKAINNNNKTWKGDGKAPRPGKNAKGGFLDGQEKLKGE